jgi:hypothetical protein
MLIGDRHGSIFCLVFWFESTALDADVGKDWFEVAMIEFSH